MMGVDQALQVDRRKTLTRRYLRERHVNAMLTLHLLHNFSRQESKRAFTVTLLTLT